MYIKNVLLSENRKFWGNKLLWITVVAVLVVLIGAMSAYFCTARMHSNQYIDREAKFSEYEEERERS